MTARWDIYGLIGMTNGGQGFVYGKLHSPADPKETRP